MPTSRTTPTNTSIPKVSAVATPDVLTAIKNVKSLTSTDVIEVWGDGTIWDATTNAAICVDLLGFTGTPRKRI